MIKNFKLFESHDDIHRICSEHNITNYTINDDGSIDVNDSVFLNKKNLKALPLKFRNVVGYFYCSRNKLASLKGCPTNVNGVFNCGENRLTSLEGSPINIGLHFMCPFNSINSLKGCPKNIKMDFHCSDNQISSLEGFPEYLGRNFNCNNNPIYPLVSSWINGSNRNSMVEYFNDLDIIRDDGKTIILDRLEEFMDIYNIKIDLKEVEKHYTII